MTSIETHRALEIADILNSLATELRDAARTAAPIPCASCPFPGHCMSAQQCTRRVNEAAPAPAATTAQVLCPVCHNEGEPSGQGDFHCNRSGCRVSMFFESAYVGVPETPGPAQPGREPERAADGEACRIIAPTACAPSATPTLPDAAQGKALSLKDAANNLIRFNGHHFTCRAGGRHALESGAACTCGWEMAVGAYKGARLFADNTEANLRNALETVRDELVAVGDQLQSAGIESDSYKGALFAIDKALRATPSAPPVQGERRRLTIADFVTAQREWSERTFGPGPRAKGNVDHIRKELAEIEANPSDLVEWCDVATLALDGAWREGHEPEAIAAALFAKLEKNKRRQWPDWRTSDPDKGIQHIKSTPAVPESGLRECPFCGISLDPWDIGLFRHPANDCWMRDVSVDTANEQSVTRWNTRAPSSAQSAAETWAWIERVLVEECGLLADQGVASQRQNFVSAIAHGRVGESLLKAAAEFLSVPSLARIRVDGCLMDRDEVADALTRLQSTGGAK